MWLLLTGHTSEDLKGVGKEAHVSTGGRALQGEQTGNAEVLSEHGTPCATGSGTVVGAESPGDKTQQGGVLGSRQEFRHVYSASLLGGF